MLVEFGIVSSDFVLRPRYNIAPTQDVAAVVSDGTERRIGSLRWGLVPPWSESAKPKFATFNARAETLLKNATWKRLVPRKRCIIPADGFYEWQSHGDTKRPLRIRLKDRKVFGFAGLYDSWISRDGAQKISSCTIITTEPNEFMSAIHNRMPAILRREDEDLWLDHTVTDTDLITQLLRPYPAEEMYAYPVHPMVGNVNNNLPECVEEYVGD
ncbi:SOS response-associated peptidase [Alicyclobacillus cycloheptanicus]|uniref:Abasic site processing protein n=2 Tax=Alicyclobacillus cycloheptanicus TaxID=1457 RepID=A0ABT9XML5_9BACL|nr:SOS response-associated peptidase [Alicyclobacillus cycloheptanicus]MDQ0191269.1 putative SOS response-associated peptidase YedK [Alicyclobacillus cycloheptanicus]